MSLHPALEHVRDSMLTRRGLREKFGHHVVTKARHDPLQVAYQYIGEGWCFKVLYCPACLRGHVIDLVRNVPASALSAKELGLRQMRPWRLKCMETLARGIAK